MERAPASGLACSGKLLYHSSSASDTNEQFRNEPSMSHTRVLLADDLAPVLGAVVALLPDSFDVVRTVSDGKAALDAILELKPDLVVLDISMPGMSGIEVARELKIRANKTKIVFLTVDEDSGIIAACLAAGGLGYVVKELIDSDLILAMNEALAGRIHLASLSSVRNSGKTSNVSSEAVSRMPN
jgi:DNA-binding NarL/FixJ family response regulator